MIVCFGSINLDLIFPVPHIPNAGETVLGPSTCRIEPGGKGANQAVAAARGWRACGVRRGRGGRCPGGGDALVLLRRYTDVRRVS